MTQNLGDINYSLNKNDFYKILTGNLIYFIPYYYALLFISSIFLITIRFKKYYFSDRDEQYRKDEDIVHYFKSITFNSPFKIINLYEDEKDNDKYIGLSSSSYLIIIVSYCITFIIILTGLIRNLIYSIYVNMIQTNPNNNPYKNINCVTKINESSLISTIANYSSIISISFIYLVPFIIPFLIKFFKFDNYDIKKSSWFGYLILYCLLFPFINVLLSKVAFYSKLEIFPLLNKFLEKKDYDFVNFIKNNYNFRIRFLLILILIVLIYGFYVIVFADFKYERNDKIKLYLLIFLALFIIIPLVIFFFSINLVFSNNFKDKVKHSELIKNIKDDGVQSLYELLVKYNYPCFFK